MSAPARIAAPFGVLLCVHGAQAALSSARPSLDERGIEADPAQLCRAAIALTERDTRIPDAFLSAIGRVESGRPSGGSLSPWPWTVNAAGVGHFYPTKAAAMDAVRQFQGAGIRSIDVGCLQVNLFYHPDAFASLDQAFDPAANAAFAARLLLDLFATTGSWPRAAAAYHSMTPALGQAYQQKVLEEWAVPDQPGPTMSEDSRRSARLHMTTHQPPAILPAGAPPRPTMTVALPPPAAPPPPAAEAPPGGIAPALGFNRRFMLPAAQPAVGRGLAAYRAMPVQLAWRQAVPAAIGR